MLRSRQIRAATSDPVTTESCVDRQVDGRLHVHVTRALPERTQAAEHRRRQTAYSGGRPRRTGNREYQIPVRRRDFPEPVRPVGTPPVTRKDPVHPGETDPAGEEAANLRAPAASDCRQLASRLVARVAGATLTSPDVSSPTLGRPAGVAGTYFRTSTPKRTPGETPSKPLRIVGNTTARATRGGAAR
jgi:hypothetical protein